MAYKKVLKLTDEHIKLISNIKFEKFIFEEKEHYQQLKNLINDLILSNDKKHEEINNYVIKQIFDFDPHSRFGWGCDQWSLFGGTYVLEDVAMILGYFDQAIENSENLATGRRFPEELEEKMYNLYQYIYQNLDDIITIVFNNIENGIKAGTYEFDGYKWNFKN